MPGTQRHAAAGAAGAGRGSLGAAGPLSGRVSPAPLGREGAVSGDGCAQRRGPVPRGAPRVALPGTAAESPAGRTAWRSAWTMMFR